ncbi:MAG: DUF2163 domain-containing protein [Chloroflexi bacterium]|nr:DUF2163 domain-containing protein [Chloroflexota bacterium]
MPRNLTTAMQAHLQQPYVTLACCWRIDLADGSGSFGFTSHTRSIVFGGLTYTSTVGITPSTVSQESGTSIDNMEVMAIVDGVTITEEDLITGRYDYARITVFLTNWQDPAGSGQIIVMRGTVGEVRYHNGEFTTEARSLLQATAQDILGLTSPLCRYKLGDAGCTVNLAGNSADGHAITQARTVGTVTGRKVFTVTAIDGYSGFFQYGTARFTSGQNAGRSMEIKNNSGATITLQQDMPHDIAAGDAVTLVAGCDWLIGTCSTRYNNVINFGGEPYVPGVDTVLQQPTS